MKVVDKEKALIVGLGEVGRPLFELLRESDKFSVYAFDVDEAKMREVGQNPNSLPSEVNTMHVCIPYKDADFEDAVVNYVKRFRPKLVIINSTVAPGTTMSLRKRCNCLVAHSPIRGVHVSLEHMKWELKRYTKYVGGANAEAGEAARRHFEKMSLKTKVLRSCTESELAKLFETTYRAWMIACFQEMHRISRSSDADFDQITDFIEDTHRMRWDRPIMFPGVIGGHCVIPNTDLLLKSYDSEFLHLIEESNEKRKKEMEDKYIKDEVEKVKKRVEAFDKEIEEEKR
jgi:UDP-N-acetyl-D-mannosaminuronate dehydrogenase